MAKTVNGALKTGRFPDPLAPPHIKESKEYGLLYSRAIEQQWDLSTQNDSFYLNRIREFEVNRDYAFGRQDTQIYKQQLTALDNNDGDTTLLNLDWRPLPIVPKYVKIVTQKTLDRKPTANLEAIDPLSLTEKDKAKAKMRAMVKQRDMVAQAEQMGIPVEKSARELPETTEEAEIYLESNVKTDAEIASQIGVALTLSWNDFDEKLLRRIVTDLVVCGMGVPMRINDPTYGIVERYVNPSNFIHSYTEDPTFSDCTYFGHVETMSIDEFRRVVGEDISEEDLRKILAANGIGIGTRMERMGYAHANGLNGVEAGGYDENMIDVLFFQYKTTEKQWFEEKETKYGNKGYYYKGNKYKVPENSVYERKPSSLDIEVTYSGIKVVGLDLLYCYKKDNNMPRNLHDISRTNMHYFPVATELRHMLPTSMVGNIRGFADMIQLTHLKWQQALAKVKHDGIAIDVNGLENVQLGKGGDLTPIDIQDIYEKTSVFWYRSEMIDGQRTANPIQPIPQQAQVFNQLSISYNQYVRMIQDITGVNDAMDGSSPKGEQLVGVREQAINAGNNAIYDITVATKNMYKKVSEDIVKCLQVIPRDSILYKMYEQAIGSINMKVLTSFENLPMYNIGVRVVLDMDDMQRMYLEQNIQASIAAGELDVEDAIAIRGMRDLDQAEKLLVVRRKNRMKRNQEMQLENIQAQGQANEQAAIAKLEAEAKIEEIRMQLEIQKQAEIHKLEMEKMQLEYMLKERLARVEAETKFSIKDGEHQQREALEQKREEAKDKRQREQAQDQSYMIEQRKGTMPPLKKEQPLNIDEILGA